VVLGEAWRIPEPGARARRGDLSQEGTWPASLPPAALCPLPTETRDSSSPNRFALEPLLSPSSYRGRRVPGGGDL
jgi:hypothetical protein